MKSGNSEKKFNESRDLHDSVNGEMEDLTKKYAPVSEEKKTYNPLTQEGVNEKSYARPNIKITATEANESIPEPMSTAPPQKKEEDSAQKSTTKKTETIVNPQLADLPQKEREMAAKQAAEIAINAYEAINQLGNHLIRINENKVKKLTKSGLLNLDIPLPVNGVKTTIGKYIESYNEEVSDTFSVSSKFKEEILPPLQRYFEKKGIGASDEQSIIYIIGKDLTVKIFQGYALLGAKKDTLNQLIEITEAYNKGNLPNGNNAQQNAHYSAPNTSASDAKQSSYANNYSANNQEQNIKNDTGKNQSGYSQASATSYKTNDEVVEPEIIPNEIVFDSASNINEYKPKPNIPIDISGAQKGRK